MSIEEVMSDQADGGTIAVSLRNVSKSFGVVQALVDISIDVVEGEVLGLVGENGAGKSTLISILSGVVTPDAGAVFVGGRKAHVGDPRGLAAMGVSVVSQEQALAPSLRVYENLFLAHEYAIGKGPWLPRRKMKSLAQDVLRECGLEDLPASALVSSLTYPQRQLVEIAKAFAWARLSGVRPIILLDEPTSGLSEKEADVLFSLVDRWRTKAAFIFVSHILRDVLKMCDRLVVLKDGKFVRSLDANGLTDSDLHELMVGRSRVSDYYHEGQQGAGAQTSIAISLAAATGSGFEDVDLHVKHGEVVGLAGVLGSGKSEVAAAMAGATRLTHGTVSFGGAKQKRWSVASAIRHGVFFVPPERATDSIFATRSVKQNIAIGFLDDLTSRVTRLIRRGTEERLASEYAKRMAVKSESLSTPLGELSGGNQQKAVFARWLGRDCKALILDDPTRGIDVGSREEIYLHVRTMASNGAGVVLCSESLEEVIGLADRIVVMKDGRIAAEMSAPADNKPTEIDVVRYMT
jgi:ribose transport system ATP-binding protein